MKTKLPDIYIFNPTCEYAIANGTDSWQPNKLLKKMELDLEVLPIFFTKPEDNLIVNKIPSKHYTDSLKQLNIDIPTFVHSKEIINNSNFILLPKNRLNPWGWSPAVHKVLSSLKENCSKDFKNSPVYNWLPQHRNLYSKKFASGILRSLLQDYSNDIFIQQHHIPEVCTTQAEFEILIKKWGEIMVKAPWSSSGRGLQPIRKKEIHSKLWDKVIAVVKEQGYAIAEPYLNKVLDLAFQFEMVNGKVNYLGISNFSTDSKGQYIGNNLNGLPNNLENNLLEFAKSLPEIIVPALISVIEKSDLARYYEGIFGVDTLIYLNDKKELKVNPCLEINVRQNMGLLSIYFERLIHSEKKGLFRIYYKPGISFYQFSKEMGKKYPLKITNYKIESGFFPLIDISKDTRFGAYIIV